MKFKMAARMLLTAAALLCLLGSQGCSLCGGSPRVVYLRGDYEAIPLREGDVVKIPPGWSGAWMLSDEALSGLMECCVEAQQGDEEKP